MLLRLRHHVRFAALPVLLTGQCHSVSSLQQRVLSKTVAGVAARSSWTEATLPLVPALILAVQHGPRQSLGT